MWSNYSQEFGASTALDMTLSGEHPYEMRLATQKEQAAEKTSPTQPPPERKQLRLDAFDRSAALTPQSLSSRPKNHSPLWLIALLGHQSIINDVTPPPPDFFLS